MRTIYELENERGESFYRADTKDLMPYLEAAASEKRPRIAYSCFNLGGACIVQGELFVLVHPCESNVFIVVLHVCMNRQKSADFLFIISPTANGLLQRIFHPQ